MKIALRKIGGPWDAGWALDKHIVKSTYLGDDAYGHPTFDTERTEVGKALYLLKYKHQWDQVDGLARAIHAHICPLLPNIGFVVPMPATKPRSRQPVTAVVESLGELLGVHVATDLLVKAPGGKSLKDLDSKAERSEAIGDSVSVVDRLAGEGPWNVLLVDDLFDTGASMEAACKVLRMYPKVAKIYVAALTWK